MTTNMVTKAYITALPAPKDNHFMVRIPILEDNTGEEVIMEALLCSQPGDFGGYQVGDCVFVSFEGDKHMDDSPIGEVPVIIGKLYQDDLAASPSNVMVEALTVTEQVSLPQNVKIGKYNAGDIFKIVQNLGYITDKTDQFSGDLEKSLQDVDDCISRLAEISQKIEELENTYNLYYNALQKIAEKLDVSMIVPNTSGT